jgi:hypothetical protein
MHLSNFGMISLDGSVSKPEPGLDFVNYQAAMANYGMTVALQSRLGIAQQDTQSPEKSATEHKKITRD